MAKLRLIPGVGLVDVNFSKQRVIPGVGVVKGSPSIPTILFRVSWAKNINNLIGGT